MKAKPPKILFLERQILDCVRIQYGLTNIEHCEVLAGGGWNSLFLLSTDISRLVLRIGYRQANDSQLQFEHNLISTLSRELSFVPPILTTKSGMPYILHGPRAVSVFGFVEGQRCNPEDPNIRVQCASCLGLIHRCSIRKKLTSERYGYSSLTKLDWENNHMWTWAELDSLLAGRSHVVKRLFQRYCGSEAEVHSVIAQSEQIRNLAGKCLKWVRRMASEDALPAAAIHGDFAPRNVLVNRGQISGVIDWDDCQSEWLVWDLAKALWEFCRVEATAKLDLDQSQEFIAAYESSAGIRTIRDISQLFAFVWCVRCVEILYSLGDALKRDVWYPGYLLSNLRAATELSIFID